MAAFDFDGTLTRRDSLLPFLLGFAGWPRCVRALVAAALRARDRDAFKAKLLAGTLGGRSWDDVAAAGDRYGTRLASSRIRPEMRERIAWHRGEGHEVVIVSASLDVYLDAVGRDLGFDEVLCTRLETDEGGRCTGAMAGGNCRGDEKAARLRTYLGDCGATLWAYGDTAGDDAMLAMADHPVRVRER